MARFILVFCCISLLSIDVLATDTGIFGRYQQGCGGTCHGGAANQATALSLGGPTKVRSGESHDYSFTVTNRAQDAAGMNVAFLSGAGAKSGVLTAGANQRGGVGELTHDAPVDLDGAGRAKFDFTWKAPDAHGIYTFNGAGNAVDDNGNTNGDVWNTLAQQITVSGITVQQPTNNQAFCQGGTIVIKWTQTGIRTMRLELSNNNFATSTNIANNADATTGEFTFNIPITQEPAATYQIRFIDIDGQVELGRTGVFVISGGPTITQQPADTEVCEGRTLELNVAAIGNQLAYQWRKNGNDIPNATNAQLRITNVKVGDAGTYDCVVTSCEVDETSSEAIVTILQTPKVEEQPTSVAVCPGGVAEFNCSVVGDGVTYQWLKNGVPISGKTTRILVFNSVAATDEGLYTCRISATCPPQFTTDTVALDVITLPVLVSNPTGGTFESGASVSLSADTEGDKLKFQWNKNGEAIPGATDATLEFASIRRSDSGSYSLIVYNDCDTVESTTAIVRVTAAAGPGILELAQERIDLGMVSACSTTRLTIEGFVFNDGGQPVVLQSLTAQQGVTVNLVPLPVTIGVGESIDVEFVVQNPGAGEFTLTVQFSDGTTNKTVVIEGRGVSVIEVAPDTLEFAIASSGDTKCAVSLPAACAGSILGYELSEEGAETYRVGEITTFPIPFDSAAMFEVCVTSIDTTSKNALLTINTTLGSAVVVLKRTLITSVDEDPLLTTRVSVWPNPMTDELVIRGEQSSRIKAHVYTVLGNLVATLSGVGEIRWNGTDRQGASLVSGLYVIAVQHGMNTEVHKVLIDR